MDKETAKLISYLVGGIVAFLVWRLLRSNSPRAGVFDNRLKDIKKEREKDEDSVPL